MQTQLQPKKGIAEICWKMPEVKLQGHIYIDIYITTIIFKLNSGNLYFKKAETALVSINKNKI